MLASIGIDKLIGDLMSSVGLVFGIILIVLGVMLKMSHTLLSFIPNALFTSDHTGIFRTGWARFFK